MLTSFRALLHLFFCVTLFLSCTNASSQKTVNDFSLLNTNGKMVSLADYPDAKGFVIIFTCNHCPFAKLYPERINALYDKFLPLGIPVIAISSTDTIVYEEDSYPNMVKKATEEHFKFPYLYDNTQAVAKNFKADQTPHAFIIWKENKNWVVKYNGAIDDNGAEPKLIQHKYIEEAVDALLKNKDFAIKETRSIGCKIHFRKGS